MGIRLKRAYEKAARGDGRRVLVDRMWPRGVGKEELKIDLWAKDIAPSAELRKWFHANPQQWSKFKQKYRKELDAQKEAISELRAWAKKGVTLVYASKDNEHNNAVVLKEYIEER